MANRSGAHIAPFSGLTAPRWGVTSQQPLPLSQLSPTRGEAMTMGSWSDTAVGAMCSSERVAGRSGGFGALATTSITWSIELGTLASVSTTTSIQTRPDWPGPNVVVG